MAKKRKLKNSVTRYGLRTQERWYEKVDISGAVRKLEDQRVRSRLNFIFLIALAAVLGALAAILFFQEVSVLDNSMEPTIQTGDSYFMNQMVYQFSNPDRGDLVVFKTSGSDDAALHVSRVIGLPGEDILIENGRIYIDDKLFGENGKYPTIANPGLAAETISLGSDEFFVLGDNRNNSQDSRYSDIGSVKKKYLVGRIWFRFRPSNRMGFV